MMRLDENIFDDIVPEKVPDVEFAPIEAEDIELKGPNQGPDTGIANLIHDLIINAHETVVKYNNAVASCEARPELVPVFQEIANIEMLNIGKLEEALKTVSENAENISGGTVEVKAELTVDSEATDLDDESNKSEEEVVTESLNEEIYTDLDKCEQILASRDFFAANELSDEELDTLNEMSNAGLYYDAKNDIFYVCDLDNKFLLLNYNGIDELKKGIASYAEENGSKSPFFNKR